MYTDLNDSALDELVQDAVSRNDLVDLEALRAMLHVNGHHVQRRVHASIRTNPKAAASRTVLHRPQQRSYQVAGLNSPWHRDGNPKMIR